MRSPINNKVLDVLKTLILPLLLVVFPALFFHGQKIANLLSPSLLRAFLLYSVAGILIFCIFCALTRGRVVKAANVALTLLIFFYAYTKVYGYLVRQDIIQVESYTLFPLFLLLAIYASWFVMKGSPPILWDDIVFVKKLKSAKLFRQLADRKAVFILIIILFPLLLNIVTIIGLSKADPALLLSGLGYKVQPGFLAGRFILDESVGFSKQPMGYRAAVDLLQGHIPWWNPYSGVGMPLAGEIQSAALFPLTLIRALPGGFLWFDILLQIITGLATYFLLRRLRFDHRVALVGALLYEVNGSFSWLASAPSNVIPFLPLLLLGVETAREHAQRGRGGGWLWITVALALSLYAGFPELAYLNGLFVACWVLLRLIQGPSTMRAMFLGKVVLGVIAGLCLAAPILIAFLDFTSVAYLGRHTWKLGGEIASLSVPRSLATIFLPYIRGPIQAFREVNWYQLGGYGGVGLLALAVTGLFGHTETAVRRLLGAWVVVTLSASFGVPIINNLVAAVPGVSMTVFYRFIPPSWEFALCLLAAFAIEDIRQLDRKGLVSRLAIGFVVISAVAAIALLDLNGMWHNLWETSGGYRAWFLGSLSFGALVIIGLLGASRAKLPGWRAVWISSVLVLEAAVYFFIPIGARPAEGQLALGGVRFLQQNLGFQRFYTLDPIHANYGASFGIASINHSYLPVSQAWIDYVEKYLDSNLDMPHHFYGRHNSTSSPTAADELRDHLANYEAVGVKYVVALPGDNPFLQTVGAVPVPLPQEVYSDQVMTIYELPNPAPYVRAMDCTLQALSRTEFVVDCPAPSQLIRLELYMDGWQAEVNAEPVAISLYGEIFQQIALPKGHSVVQFSFVPLHMQAGAFLFGLGWIVLAFEFVPAIRARIRAQNGHIDSQKV